MSSEATTSAVPRENPLYSIVFNIALPTMALHKLSAADRLGPTKALALAVALPLGYGVYDYFRRRQLNLFSVIGLMGVLLTGGLGLFQVGGFWFAVKEASIPAILGIVVLGSSFVGRPFISTVLLNDQLLHLERMNEEIRQRQVEPQFQALLSRTNWLLGGSFFLSAALNFALAILMLKSPAGTAEFNQELAQMTALSFVVIAVPSIACVLLSMWAFFRGMKKLTGLEAGQLLRK